MNQQPEPVHPHGTPTDEVAWLERQDKAMLIEIICQLRWAVFVGPKMLDEAILRAHQNRLQAQHRTLYAKVAEFSASAVVDLPTREYNAAWRQQDRHVLAWQRAMTAMDDSWNLKPGFHREPMGRQ